MDYSTEINLALKEYSLGKKKSAYKKLKKIFDKNPYDDQLRFNLAIVAQSLNLNKEAKDNYIYLIEKNNNHKAMVNLYLLYIQEANYFNALNIINKLLIYKQGDSDINKNKAFVLYKLKRYEESISLCKNFLSTGQDLEFLNILGLNHLDKNEFNKSEKIFKQALSIDKNNLSVLNSLGRMYHEKRDSKNAEYYLLKAYNLKNNSYEIINNLAGFYREEGKYLKSIELYLQALKVNPQNSTILNNLAKAFFDVNDFKASEKYCLQGLSLNKKDGNIQKLLSLIYLRQNNYSKGWSYFDGRLNLSDFVEKNTSINNIREKLLSKKRFNKKSKTLVIREQGVGDEILYGTMYKDLLEFCENTTIECDPRLKNIFCNSFPKYRNSFIEFGSISSNKRLLSDFDLVLYAGSLGKFFRNSIEDFDDGYYLKPDSNLLKKSKEKLEKFEGKFKIGLSWKSFNNRYANEKSLVLEDLNNLFETKNCSFINLQYGNVNNEIKLFNKKFNRNLVTIKNLDIFNDFENLASLLKNLDLFITVSNSTAHLAGSLGVKTLLIRPTNHAVFHYWNQAGIRTPWYKSIIFIEKNEIINEKNLLSKFLNL